MLKLVSSSRKGLLQTSLTTLPSSLHLPFCFIDWQKRKNKHFHHRTPPNPSITISLKADSQEVTRTPVTTLGPRKGARGPGGPSPAHWTTPTHLSFSRERQSLSQRGNTCSSAILALFHLFGLLCYGRTWLRCCRGLCTTRKQYTRTWIMSTGADIFDIGEAPFSTCSRATAIFSEFL